MKLYNHKLETLGIQRTDGFHRFIDNKVGFLSSFLNKIACHPTYQKCDSYINLQMSNFLKTKTQYGYFCGVSQGLGVLMWYSGMILTICYHFLRGK